MTARGLLATLAAAIACAGFVALGLWQLERRTWKHALIERVAARAHAVAVPAPGRDEWPDIAAATHEYRRVRLAGTLLHEHEALVQATTARGAGFWVLTPLRRADGSIVLINRGFVESRRRDRTARGAGDPAGEFTIVGLLRISEPRGGFLRQNDPAADRWHSRDVAAIAAARGLADVAPYFVDAERSPADAEGAPVGGLTVIAFSDNHLGYALTWFTLAAMAAAAGVMVLRFEHAGIAR